MNGEVICLVGCEKKLLLEQKTLQMLPIYSLCTYGHWNMMPTLEVALGTAGRKNVSDLG